MPCLPFGSRAFSFSDPVFKKYASHIKLFHFPLEITSGIDCDFIQSAVFRAA